LLKMWKPSSTPDWKARNSATIVRARMELSAQKCSPSKSKFSMPSMIVMVPKVIALGNHLLVKKVPSTA